MNWFRKYYVHLLFAVAILLFAASFVRKGFDSKVRSEAAQVERSLHKRQKVAEAYTVEALKSDIDLSRFSNLPEDIVIYRYNSDTLQYWFNQFPISNDNIESYSFSYRLQYLDNRNRNVTPLAYISGDEQYVNLGSGWYVVKENVSEDRRLKVLTGILIRTDYSSERVSDRVNPNLNFSSDFTSHELGCGEGAVVKGRDDTPLFTVVPIEIDDIHYGNINLRWLSLVILLIAGFVLHLKMRNVKSFCIFLGILVAIRVCASLMVSSGVVSGELFSPILYADSNLVNSLGSLLVNNVLFSFAVYASFVIRKKVPNLFCLIFAAVLLTVYIVLSIRSLSFNSNIVLEFFRISEFNIYSIVCYLSIAMLFLALLLLVGMISDWIWHGEKFKVFTWKFVLLYTALVALYCTIALNTYSLKKEVEINHIRTGKLAVERDLSLEIYLRQVEYAIANDRFIAVLTGVNGGDLIKNRLIERYFYDDIIRNYNIKLTLCSPDNLINLGEGMEPVGCFNFYEDMVSSYGTPLDPTSNFFYLNNFDGLISYIGIFTYVNEEDYSVSRLFLEIESKFQNDVVTDPLDMLTSSAGNRTVIPSRYSFARYTNGRLVNHGGTFDYSVEPPQIDDDRTYTTVFRNGYLHFVNRLSDDDMAIVSRPRTPVVVYLVSFSYLFIFFAFFLLAMTHWCRTDRAFNLPRHSMRRKITVLIVGSMVIALICTGVGSVVHVLGQSDRKNRSAMDDKIATVQKTLSPYCKFAMRYSDVDNPQLEQAMESVASITQGCINLFDTYGNLLLSTKPEIFEQTLVGPKMNWEAYDAICRRGAIRFISDEKIADIDFKSVYAPIFNGDGKMVAVASVPYFTSSVASDNEDVSAITAIANVYLLLLIAAIIIGTILSNSFAKPLAEIKDKLDVVGRENDDEDRHIEYVNKHDELGTLIESYNKMVDDLEESKVRLAQTEREQAWKEMARQIAHEIKNPLTPMRLSIQYLMKLKAENVPGWEDKLEKVSKSLLEQIDTLSETASEFSSYSKFYAEAVADVNLDEIIREQAVLFDNREDISVEYIQEVETPIVEARRSQISRVLVNLVANSIQAIENASGKGRVKIMLKECSMEEKAAYRISIEDDGPGVSEEHRDKLFTPNFTTKSGGTGLGLAISKSIIEQSGGTIGYNQSELLGGACFTIILPAK